MTAAVLQFPVWLIGAPECPLPWRRALLCRGRFKVSEKRLAEAWLRQKGWWLEHYSAFGDDWIDPLDGVDYCIEGATRKQAVREVQKILEPRGYRLFSGGIARDGRTWTYAGKVRAPGGKRDIALSTAIKREGLA